MKLLKPLKFSLVCMSICFIVFNACDEEFIEANTEVDTSYYPLEVGNYIIYSLDSTVYDDFVDTNYSVSLIVRELIESTFIDARGDEAYRIERSYKWNESDNWGDAGFDIWFTNFQGNNAEKVEESQRYIKLAFPLSLGKTWHGNSYINTDPIDDGSIDSIIESPLLYLEGWEYEVITLHEPMTLNGISFDSTTTILQHEYGIATDTIGSIEVYAKGVGLIQKGMWKLTTQCSHCDPNDVVCKALCFYSTWDGENGKAEAGFIVKLEILEYGKL